MDRRDIILEYIRKDQRGIEIGPSWNPLVPKAAGWDTLNLDVFDARTLREKAINDRNVPSQMVSNIEEVDLLGPAHQLRELAVERGLNNIDFIISSHNFEHLPNPVSFLHSCSEVLRSGGLLSMAIPDKRACFDYFRPLSTLGSILAAYFEKHSRPSSTQIFEQQSLHSRYCSDTGDHIGFSLTDDPRHIVAFQTVEDAYQGLCARRAASSCEGAPYEDVHCWTFTPNSFRLLMLDLSFLRLIDFVPIKIYDTHGGEFYVHLRNMRGIAREPLSSRDYYDKRQKLLHAANADAAEAGLREAQAAKDASEAELQQVQAELQQVQAELQQVQAAKDAAEAELQQVQAALDATYRSHSWRVTRPLRTIITAMCGMGGPT
jgi:predicted SAM-dependent methyltransferase